MLVLAALTGATTALVAVVLVYRQIVERRAAGNALQNVQARAGGLLESAMDAIIVIDEAQRILQYNAAAEKVFLWPRDAMLGQPLDKLIPERYRGAHKGHVGRFGNTGVTSRRMGDRTVVTGLRANGEEFPIEASISQHREDGVTLFTVILRDISERVRVEEQQSRGEARLRGILDSAMDAVITVDEGQHIVLFNGAAEKVFGCPHDEAIGAPLSWLIPERFRSEHAQHMKHFGETGTTSRRMGAARRIMGLRRNGEEFPIEASISQVIEDGARFYTVILRDVTERAQAEEALARSRDELNEQAAASHTMLEQEKSRVARELHDELAQALTALKLDVAWLDERARNDAEMREKLAKMRGILDNTVAATRRIAADLRPLMLDDLGFLPAAEWLVQNFRERNRIDCKLMVEQEDIELDEPYATSVFRILQESLTNIAKHAQANRVEVSLDQFGGEMRLTVQDDGKGFDPADPRKPNSYGLLGLRERVHLVGGDVKIDSTPGRGTRIAVRIPTNRTRTS
jgi:PAS domain S-box-containing protein